MTDTLKYSTWQSENGRYRFVACEVENYPDRVKVTIISGKEFTDVLMPRTEWERISGEWSTGNAVDTEDSLRLSEDASSLQACFHIPLGKPVGEIFRETLIKGHPWSEARINAALNEIENSELTRHGARIKKPEATHSPQVVHGGIPTGMGLTKPKN